MEDMCFRLIGFWSFGMLQDKAKELKRWCQVMGALGDEKLSSLLTPTIYLMMIAA
jgi:hypothetical protein